VILMASAALRHQRVKHKLAAAGQQPCDLARLLSMSHSKQCAVDPDLSIGVPMVFTALH